MSNEKCAKAHTPSDFASIHGLSVGEVSLATGCSRQCLAGYAKRKKSLLTVLCAGVAAIKKVGSYEK